MSIHRWKICFSAALLMAATSAAHAHFFSVIQDGNSTPVPPGGPHPIELTGSEVFIRVMNDGSEQNCTTQVTATVDAGTAVSIEGTGVQSYTTPPDDHVDTQINVLNNGTAIVTVSWVITQTSPSCSGSNSATFAFSVEGGMFTMVTSTANFSRSGAFGDPINLFTAELFDSFPADIDIGGPMALAFSRYYASGLVSANISGRMGDNWRHRFEWSLSNTGTEIEIINDRGRVIQFTQNGAVWDLTGKSDVAYQLVENAGVMTLLDPQDDSQYQFNAAGQLTSIADGLGNVHALTYDGSGQLTQVADGLGRILTMTYDGAGNLDSVTDGARIVTFAYTGNDLTSYTDALGNVTTYAYDPGGLMTSSVRPAGNTPFTQTYDVDGKVTTQTDSNSNTVTFTYADPATTVTDPLGNTLVYTHTATGELSNLQDQAGLNVIMASDSTGRLSQLTDRLGAITSLTYHAPSGKVASVINADGTTTSNTYTARVSGDVTVYDLTGITHEDGTTETFVYDALGNLISHTDQAGNILTGTYDANGMPLTATNEAGGITTHTYDADATRLSTTDPAGNVTSFDYDALKRPVLTTFADANTQVFSYDAEDRLLAITDENGNTQTFTYDANGNQLTITDALVNTTTFTYDGNDRPLTTLDPLGGVISDTYDQLGRLETMTDENGNTVTLGYDALGRLTSITDPLGNTSTETYDAEGVIASSTDPLGNTTLFTSDQMGRITQESSPLGNLFGTSYDSLGRVVTTTDPLGNITTFSWESRGLLSAITLPGGTISTAYTRNALGQITGITDPNGNDWLSTFDNQGRLTSEIDPLANTSTFTYDNRNRPSSIGFPGVLGTLTMIYDPVGNLTQDAYSDGTTLNYSYDANNRLITANGISRTYDANNRISDTNGIAIGRDPAGQITSMTLAVGKTVTYTYDANDNLTQVSDWTGGISTFTYDAADRLITYTRPNGITTSYTYDNDSRLVGITEGAISSITLTLDANARITNAVRVPPEAQVISQLPSTNLAFDAASQVDSFSYDDLGRLTNDGTTTYVWDLASRISSYTRGGNTTSFTYDALGNRLSRTVSGVTRDYVWNEALELTSISIEKLSGVDLRYYIHAPDGSLLYSIAAADDSRRDYHFDEIGNTFFVTDATASVIASYVYTPYGEVLSSSGSIDNNVMWQGEFGVMHEGDSLYYVRARYYDAITSRFISRDPIGAIDPKEVNPYQYALANPLLFVDPVGTEARNRRAMKKAKRKAKKKAKRKVKKKAKRKMKKKAKKKAKRKVKKKAKRKTKKKAKRKVKKKAKKKAKRKVKKKAKKKAKRKVKKKSKRKVSRKTKRKAARKKARSRRQAPQDYVEDSLNDSRQKTRDAQDALATGLDEDAEDDE